MVVLEEHKKQTHDKVIMRLPEVSRVYIPLSQHLGKICNSEVKAGDSVYLGQRIASVEAKVSAPVHSSVSGKVLAIQDHPHPVLGVCKAIVIENDGQEKPQSYKVTRSQEQVNKLKPEEIREIVFNAGIVGMGGAAFPTHIKLTPPKALETLIINGAECEPYLAGDYRLMIEKTEEIIKGIELIRKCLNSEKVYIAIEDNKPGAIKAFRSVIGYGESGIGNQKPITEHRKPIQIIILKSEYPQGGEKQLIKSVLGKEVSRGKLPFDIGVCVQNIGTVYAIYEAAYLDKPLYERVVTITGSCVSNPKNILTRIGTPIKDLISFCGDLIEDTAKIIIGGPMMGVAQYTQDVPVIKSTTGIILMNEREVRDTEELFCIRCAACIRDCPAGLMPTSISAYSKIGHWQDANVYGALDCIECGLCSYVCPSNIPLVQNIRRAKLELNR